MTPTPNVLYILADDLGYGDVSCLNPNGKIPTPNIDRLAAGGRIFTDAHSTSAVCSPSRYGVLTGRYNWRSRLQRGIVQHYEDPLIAPDRLTVGKLFQQHGYRTGCIGKWHLGMGWDFDVCPEVMPAGDRFNRNAIPTNPPVTEETRALWRDLFSRPTTGGPTTRGFDWYFGVDVPNWPPYSFIENDRLTDIPVEYLPARLFNHNQSSTPGPAARYWHFEQLLPTWAEKADAFLAGCAAERKPFFLYFPLTSPHTPISPNAAWRGASGLDSPYADFVMETDATVGAVLDSLEEHGLAEDTLVIFTSDNGFARYVGADNLEAQGHFPSGGYRGYKGDAWDGGHRIPFVARWPGVIEPRTTSNELMCLSDLMATCAEFLGAELPPDAGEDSVSLMPHFRAAGTATGAAGDPGSYAGPHTKLASGNGEPSAAGWREFVVHHSIHGKFAIRDARWKLVLCPGSGGLWSLKDEDAVGQGLPIVQLYDMANDPAETTNLHKEQPERVRSMVRALEGLVARGRTTPGPDQVNDVEVDIWKLDTLPGVDASALDDY
jgi:arylsulfatase A-like enzyme